MNEVGTARQPERSGVVPVGSRQGLYYGRTLVVATMGEELST